MATTPETTAEVTEESAPTLRDRLREAWGRLSNPQRLALMVSIAAIVAVLIGTVLYNRQPDYKVLFSNLSERDGGAIITALEQLNVPYHFSEGGGAILVPGARVHEVRLRLASQGLPKGGAVGFELMENQKFGTSQFAEQVNYQRGLEGELARTIQSIAAVENARVHLAIPKPSVFIREEQKPTASVMLHLHPGRVLEPAQIAGIQHLVSSSVPQLALNNVTVIDQSGAMLSQLKSKLLEAGLDPTQLKYVQEVENSVIKRVEDILGPVVGPNNARVQVAADIDFSQTEQTSENFKPNVTPPDVSIRSQQTSETASVNSPPQGVPGALTNQPPVPATAPLTNPPVGNQAANSTATTTGPGQVNAAGLQAPVLGAGQPLNTRKDSTINYEVDKTIRYTKQSVGMIRRLSVAVVVNHKKGSDPKTGKEITVPFSENEMKQINDLAREAMGFQKERGDALSVANAQFNLPDKSGDEVPLWKDPENISYAKDLLKFLVIGGIIIAIYLIVMKPIILTMFPPPPPEPEPEEIEPDFFADEEGASAEEVSSYELKLQEARNMAQQDPKAVAGLIKDWLGLNQQ